MMVRHILLSLAVWMLAVAGAGAQINWQAPLPVDSNLRHGTLPNGFTYYIYPQPGIGLADIKLVTRVGSVVEEPHELGLAHFLEHMTFEGTRNLPGDSSVRLINGYGMSVGGDVNATTAFDDTQFDVKNIDADDSTMLSDYLFMVKEWASNLTLDQRGIDKQRGIVEEEWRTGHNFNERLTDSMVNVMLSGSNYAHHMPIGSMQVIRNFKRQTLVDFYHKWYRPDLQALMVVGDVNADSIEAQVRELFGSIPAAAPDAPRRMPSHVPDHKGVKCLVYTDTEANSSDVGLFFLHDALPPDSLQVAECYRTQALQLLVSYMLNDRLSEHARTTVAPYTDAYCDYDKFLITQTKDAFELITNSKEGQTREAFDDVVTELRRAQLHGFLPTEWERAKAKVNALAANKLNEEGNEHRKSYMSSFVDNFENGTDLYSYHDSYLLLREVVNHHVSLNDANAMLRRMAGRDNVCVSISGPKKLGVPYPTAQEVQADFARIMQSRPEPYHDTDTLGPLLPATPQPGLIAGEVLDTVDNITTFTLGNGMKVLLKPTDYKNDEILINGYSPGGYQAYHGTHRIALRAMNEVIEGSGLGMHSNNVINKGLTGNNFSFYFLLTTSEEQFRGSSGKADLERMFQLLYLYFTDVRKDEASFATVKSRLRAVAEQGRNNPDKVFSDSVSRALYPDYAYMDDLTPAEVDQIDYDEVLNLYRERVANAGDYLFTLVGSFDVDSVKSLIATYMASLPDNGVRERDDEPVPHRHGTYTCRFSVPMLTPKSSVCINLLGTRSFSVKRMVMMQMVQNIVDYLVNDTIREQQASTYGAQVNALINEYYPQWMISTAFDTNPASCDRLIKAVRSCLNSLVTNGVSQEVYDNAYNMQVNTFNYSMASNTYWENALYMAGRGYRFTFQYYLTLMTLTRDDFNAFLTSLTPDDIITVVMEPKQ